MNQRVDQAELGTQFFLVVLPVSISKGKEGAFIPPETLKAQPSLGVFAVLLGMEGIASRCDGFPSPEVVDSHGAHFPALTPCEGGPSPVLSSQLPQPSEEGMIIITPILQIRRLSLQEGKWPWFHSCMAAF